ncbi:hypothetical protein OA84_09790 [Kaistella solincola]|uniref:DUF4136 domain-containing protein n=2 Tax=Kaistella solincola TaxID=510955 RepID=A0ABR4ZRJ4_9FLAO|nr:hypothetical protein OA84_09790 [Kaistella solincola]
MLKNLFLIFLFLTASNFNAQEKMDMISVPGPIELHGTEFFLSWSKQASKTLVRQQYLPREEKIENFTQLLDISYFNKEIDIEQAVRQKVEQIQAREKTDKLAKVNVSQNKDGTEFVVDYFISETPAEGEPFVDYVVDRFVTIEHGSGNTFLIFSYVKRAYNNIKWEARAMAKMRDEILINVVDYKIPTIRLKNIK